MADSKRRFAGCSRTCLAILLLPVVSGACASPMPDTEVVEIDCERFSAQQGDQIRLTRSIAVTKEATIVLRLCANPSTGFEWEDAVLSAPTVLAQQSRKYFPPEAPMPGGAGLEQWTFRATGEGVCTVALNYSRPWDGGGEGVWQFELEVSVH